MQCGPMITYLSGCSSDLPSESENQWKRFLVFLVYHRECCFQTSNSRNHAPYIICNNHRIIFFSEMLDLILEFIKPSLALIVVSWAFKRLSRIAPIENWTVALPHSTTSSTVILSYEFMLMRQVWTCLWVSEVRWINPSTLRC